MPPPRIRKKHPAAVDPWQLLDAALEELNQAKEQLQWYEANSDPKKRGGFLRAYKGATRYSRARDLKIFRLTQEINALLKL